VDRRTAGPSGNIGFHNRIPIVVAAVALRKMTRDALMVLFTRAVAVVIGVPWQVWYRSGGRQDVLSWKRLKISISASMESLESPGRAKLPHLANDAT